MPAKKVGRPPKPGGMCEALRGMDDAIAAHPELMEAARELFGGTSAADLVGNTPEAEVTEWRRLELQEDAVPNRQVAASKARDANKGSATRTQRREAISHHIKKWSGRSGSWVAGRLVLMDEFKHVSVRTLRDDVAALRR